MRGSIEARILPIGRDTAEGIEVRLKQYTLSIEQGDTEAEVTAATNAGGIATFSEQATDTAHQYEVIVSEGPATYSSGKFSFGNEGGMQILLPVFPATNDIRQIMALSRMALIVTPRSDVFSVEGQAVIQNFSQTTWVPESAVFPLPEGAKAFTAQKEGQARIEAHEEGFRLVGTFGPGRHFLGFRFQLPNDGDSREVFSFPTLPNMAEARVFVDSAPSMTISVEGLPEAREGVNREGHRQLIASRDFMKEKMRPPPSLEISIEGIPSRSSGRYWSSAIAGGILLFGFASVMRQRRRGAASFRSELSSDELSQANKLLLDELVALERAFEQGAIGRKVRESTRQQLLDALARLSSEATHQPA